MPNHVTNRITATPNAIGRLLNESGEVDFDRLLPMPEIMHSGDALCHVEAAAMRAIGESSFTPPDLRELDDTDFELLLTYLRAYREHGSFNWYDWACKHWSTKWNAYQTKRTAANVVEFQTAWSAPHPVVEKLAQAGFDIKHEWADEDIGSNVGRRWYSRGGTHEETLFGGTREGYELAFELMPDRRQYYKLKGDTYVYDETAA